jgi:flagellar biosynthesis protein FliQ
MNFLVRHYNISTDWNTLSKYVRSDDLLVITDNDFQFNARPYLSFKPNLITVYLPSYIIWSNDVSIINSTLENELGFIPSILYKAIKDDHIIIIFEPFKSNKLDAYTKNMIRIFHKLNSN